MITYYITCYFIFYFLNNYQTIYHSSTTAGKQWIQVDFLEPKLVSGILTQGLPNVDKWSSEFYLSTSLDGFSFKPYSESIDGTPKIFGGNKDRNSIIKHLLTRNIQARYVRLIIMKGGPDGIGMRFNVIGCFSPQTTARPSGQQTSTPTLVPGLGGTGTPTAIPPPFTQLIPGL